MFAGTTIAVIGAGSRGTIYGNWIRDHAERAKVVAVAEPDEGRRHRFAADHDIAPGNVFADAEALLGRGRIADAVLICHQDRQHVEAAVSAAALDYHILLEKPIATTVQGCIDVVEAAKRGRGQFAVCHVLRYTRFADKVAELVHGGAIGDPISMQHLEPVGWWHYPHAYVRGPWRSEKNSSPVLLAKSCHDLDWIRYVMGRRLARVSSFGSLTHFTPANKPAGAGERCLDCAVEESCAFSARRIYHETLAPDNILVQRIVGGEVTGAGIDAALAAGDFGRCVYSGDNDVNDHQVVNLELEGGRTASMTMAAFTPSTWRRSRIFGTAGFIDTHDLVIDHFDFRTARHRLHEVTLPGDPTAGGGHGGGDAALIDAFLRAVETGDPSHIRSGADESLESHLAAFAAEAARHRGTVEAIASPLG